MAGKPRQRRPDEWNQQAVIERLEMGLTLRTVCESFADHPQCEASATALQQEVYRWRKASDEFDKQVVEILSRDEKYLARRNGKPSGAPKAFELTDGKEDWWCRFVEHYATEKKPTVKGACEAAGINHTTFYARISDFEGNPNFDPELHKRWHELRLALGGYFTGVQMDAVHEVDNPYLRGILAGQVSRRLDGSDRRSTVDVRVSGQVNHNHTGEVQIAARQHVRSRMRAICTTKEGVEVLPP